eukprot:TRINITY_DN2982_c0_g1_i1.p1 TRINITY_DN2982_c0_g1~~TRINITY_DN2982_c0_g1_i1.p1  ORF type:complete len:216 (+),score=23.97 TRINITY_DN2982_c0_g1_i1:76-723(+)
MARHGTLYRVFFPRNSYDASLSIVGAWLWLTILGIVRRALIWGGSTPEVVIAGAVVGMVMAAFEIGMWLRFRLKFRRAFIKYWTLCHIILPIVYALLDLGVILTLVIPGTIPTTTRIGLFTTLKAFGTACESLAWIHFTWVTATIRSKQIVQDAKKNPDEPDEYKPVVPPSDPPKPVEEARPSIQPSAPANQSSPAPTAQPAGWNRASRPESFSQ